MIARQRPGAAGQGPLQIGQTFIWQYEILGLIGSGGHAFVYRARHRFLGHLVAIKVLHRAAGVDEQMLRRGQAEAQIEFQLKHPGIVTVHDAGLDSGGLLYIVMELLHGRSVGEALKELGRLHVVEVLTFGMKVALAMAVAHDAGVVHRDLKPENLFFTRKNEPKVLDFGIAKIDAAAGWQTQRDIVMGTAPYMSPEQIMARPVTPRSDIYSLGTILCEALLGQQPVLRQVAGRPPSFKLLTRIIVTEQLPPLNELDPSIPPYVDKLITRMTAKRPEERFASMREVAEACETCLKTSEAEALRAGRSIVIRDLWRKTPDASGEEPIGGTSAQATELDTAPASRPPFFGGLSSSSLTAVPVTRAPHVAAERGGAPLARPTFFQEPSTTAPLGSPQYQPNLPPTTAATAHQQSAAPEGEEPASDAGEDAFPEPERVALASFAPLLWGAAIGVVIFGIGAFFFVGSRGGRSQAGAGLQPPRAAPVNAALPSPNQHTARGPAPARLAPTEPVVTPVPAPSTSPGSAASIERAVPASQTASQRSAQPPSPSPPPSANTGRAAPTREPRSTIF
jgi:serine/threonine protein kinase